MHSRKQLGLILFLIIFFSAFLGVIWQHSLLSHSSRDISYSIIREHQNEKPTPTAIALIPPSQPVVTEQVNYATVNSQTATGYFAQPQTNIESLPGLIIIHEWWGLNENIEAMARRLAGEGYKVLAVDLYNGEVGTTPQEARALVQNVGENPNLAQDNLQQAYQYLVDQGQTTKVGVMGWCFGGSWSLQTALLLPQQIAATVIYYGGQISQFSSTQLQTLQMPILGIFGAEDRSIPVAEVRQFGANLDRLGKDAEIIIYENAGHAFANPSGERYVPEAAEAAWLKTIDFLNQNLAQ